MLNIFRGLKPDVTPAQVIGGLFAAVGPVCVLLGVHLNPDQLDALDHLKVVGLGLFGADAAIRVGRNYADGKTQAAAHLAAATVAPVVDDGPGIVDPETESVADDELPDDRTELASPPPPAAGAS